MRTQLQKLAQDRLEEMALEHRGDGAISDDVKNYINDVAKSGKFSTPQIVNRDNIFKQFLYCYKTLESQGLTVDLTMNGTAIVKIKVSWEINDEKGE